MIPIICIVFFFLFIWSIIICLEKPHVFLHVHGLVIFINYWHEHVRWSLSILGRHLYDTRTSPGQVIATLMLLYNIYVHIYIYILQVVEPYMNFTLINVTSLLKKINNHKGRSL